MKLTSSSTTPALCTPSEQSAALCYRCTVKAGQADVRDDDAVNTDEKIWDLTQAINVKGVWYGCKYAVIAMRNVSCPFLPELWRP